MNKFKLFSIINLILFLSACGAVKDGFTNQKKNNNDEFLVEKKSPLIMPPDYGELPTPKENLKQNNEQKSEIKSLITKKENTNSNKEEIIDKSLEETMLEKIRNN